MNINFLKKIIFMLLLIVPLCSCSANKTFEITDETAISDLQGQTIPRILDSLTLTSDNIKELTIKDKTIEDKAAKVIASINIEYTEKNAGSVNKDKKKNDVIHNLSGDIIMNYSLYDKDWHLESLTNADLLQETKTEKENLIERIPFKNKDEVLEDLKNNKKIGIRVSFADTFLNRNITFCENSNNDYKKISNTNDFTVINEVSEENDLFKLVTINMDVDFKISNDSNFPDGIYNAKGEFTVIYQLCEDSNGNAYWNLADIKQLECRITASKK